MVQAPNETTKPAYVQVRDQLRADIVSGRLPAGMRLTISDVAKRFGVSHMPVREAFKWLSSEGLLTFHPNRGGQVRNLNADFVRNVYQVRGAIEALLSRLALPHLIPSDLTALTRLHESFQQACQAGDTAQIIAINDEFHHLIYEKSHNPEALAVHRQYVGLVQALRHHYNFSPSRLSDMVAEHACFISALRNQNVALLEQIARAHCDGAMLDLLQRMEEKPISTQ
jgi:DNA-binding GntR family transcriptional regulator